MAGGAKVVQAGEVRSARIESLRALAAMSVLVGHVWLFTQGSSSTAYPQRLVEAGRYGVWLFFALTGYLLFWPFVRSTLAGGGTIDLRRYALNRVLRILPLYYVVVVVLLVVDQHGGSAGQWLRFGTLTESFSRSTVGTVDVPIWSLVVEVQFYLLLPLLAWLLLRGGSVRRAALGVAALAALSLGVWLVKVHGPAAPDLRWRYSLPATFLNFTPGMFLALLRARPVRLPRRPTALALAGVGLWLVAAAAIRWAEPLCALGAALILAALVLPVEDGALTRPLALRPLAALGVASYSLYLWHVPVIRSLHSHTGWGTLPLLACGALAAIAVAALSYLVVERPFLRLRRRWGPLSAEPAAAQPAEGAAQPQPETATA
jgi:peptidoglycan/LPS O-acetylase OafA/YrhL